MASGVRRYAMTFPFAIARLRAAPQQLSSSRISSSNPKTHLSTLFSIFPLAKMSKSLAPSRPNTFVEPKYTPPVAGAAAKSADVRPFFQYFNVRIA